MPAVQQGRDFVEKDGVEVAHMGEALAGQAVLSGGGDPGLGGFLHGRDHWRRVGRIRNVSAVESGIPPQNFGHLHLVAGETGTSGRLVAIPIGIWQTEMGSYKKKSAQRCYFATLRSVTDAVDGQP
jgi:hypothetical protein